MEEGVPPYINVIWRQTATIHKVVHSDNHTVIYDHMIRLVVPERMQCGGRMLPHTKIIVVLVA